VSRTYLLLIVQFVGTNTALLMSGNCMFCTGSDMEHRHVEEFWFPPFHSGTD